MKLSTYILTQLVAAQVANENCFGIKDDMDRCVKFMNEILKVCGEGTGETDVTDYINVGLINPRKESSDA